MPTPDLDLGLMKEGIVELDPMTGRLVLRCEDARGANEFIDVHEQLLRYKGQEVRFILTPLASVATLAQMVEQGELALDQVPTLKKTS